MEINWQITTLLPLKITYKLDAFVLKQYKHTYMHA